MPPELPAPTTSARVHEIGDEVPSLFRVIALCHLYGVATPTAMQNKDEHMPTTTCLSWSQFRVPTGHYLSIFGFWIRRSPTIFSVVPRRLNKFPSVRTCFPFKHAYSAYYWTQDRGMLVNRALVHATSNAAPHRGDVLVLKHPQSGDKQFEDMKPEDEALECAALDENHKQSGQYTEKVTGIPLAFELISSGNYTEAQLNIPQILMIKPVKSTGLVAALSVAKNDSLGGAGESYVIYGSNSGEPSRAARVTLPIVAIYLRRAAGGGGGTGGGTDAVEPMICDDASSGGSGLRWTSDAGTGAAVHASSSGRKWWWSAASHRVEWWKEEAARAREPSMRQRLATNGRANAMFPPGWHLERKVA
ncbi:hypothetical protein EV363DRAFT_1299803 [Boletus edulis]|nr:hypothetical protein EV363DRAFT_1299803 [Boletus edulis]